MRDDDTAEDAGAVHGDVAGKEAPQADTETGHAGAGGTPPFADSPSVAAANENDDQEEVPANRSAELTSRTQDLNEAVAAPEPAVAIPDTSEKGSGDSQNASKWEAGKRHWWANWVVTFAAVAVAVIALTNQPSPPNVTVPVPAVNNYMPEAAGLPGQPSLPSKTGCEVGRENFAGWGPNRPMMAAAGPFAFQYPTLNGYNEDPKYGDSRNFYRVKDAANTDAAGWSNEITDVQRGKRYYLQLYVVNSAYINDVTTAKDVRVFVTLPDCRSRQIASHGIVKSSNAYPPAIWGGVNFYSGEEFALAYVPGSAKLFNNINLNPGTSIPGTDFLESDGQLIGIDKLDGSVRAGFRYSAYFTLTVEAV